MANPQYSFDPTASLISVPSQTPSDIRTPMKVSPIPTIEIRDISLPELAEGVIKADVSNEVKVKKIILVLLFK